MRGGFGPTVLLRGFTAFVVASEYIGVFVVVDKEEDDGPLLLVAIAEFGCRDCFCKTDLLAGLCDRVLILFATEYTVVDDDAPDGFLDVRSPSGAMVHDNSPVCDTILRAISKFCVGGMF